MKINFQQNISGWDFQDSKDESFSPDRAEITSPYNQSKSNIQKKKINSSPDKLKRWRQNNFITPSNPKILSNSETQTNKFQEQNKIKQKFNFEKTFIIDELKSHYVSLPLKPNPKGNYSLKHPLISSTDFYQKSIVHQNFQPAEFNNSQLFVTAKQYSNQRYILNIKKQYLDMRMQNITFHNEEKLKLQLQSQNLVRMTRLQQETNYFNTTKFRQSLHLIQDQQQDSFQYNYKEMKSQIQRKRPNLAQLSTQINQKLKFKLQKNLI